MKVPKDLGIKIGTHEEVFWTGIKKQCEDLISKSEHEIVIQENVLLLAKKKIAEEQDKK